MASVNDAECTGLVTEASSCPVGVTAIPTGSVTASAATLLSSGATAPAGTFASASGTVFPAWLSEWWE